MGGRWGSEGEGGDEEGEKGEEQGKVRGRD